MMGKQLPAQGGGHRVVDLLDVTQKRTVNFSGELRQDSDVQLSHQGRGHYVLPPRKGAVIQENRTGDIWFMRVPE